MNPQELLALAHKARKMSYCPYSHFAVGAAIQAADGRIFCGCNIENAAFSPTLCAERVAVGKAVSEGAQKFVAVAVVGGHEDGPADFCAPCGVCRQVLREFCDDDTPIYLGRADGTFDIFLFSQLLPVSFSPLDLERK